MNTLLRRLNDMWKLPSIQCPLDFSSSFNGNASSFNVDWILSKIEKEVNKSSLDVQFIRNETSTFLQNSDEIRGTNNRVKRGAHVAVAAMAGIGLFGSGVLMGNGGGCGLSGIFGSCQDRAKENAANIDRLYSFTSSLTDYVMQIKTATDEKFFLVGNELKEIRETQNQMIETQNKNWAIIEEQFKVFEGNFHILRDCTQMLFSNQQLNFNFDTAASLLSMLYADVKSYRTALYTYRMNVLNAIPTLLQQHLPMSLVPKESLLAILKSVAADQSLSGSRLSLAIPPTDLLSYYDAKLLRDVVTLDEGLVLTLAIPLASRQTVFSTYQAQIVPMPQPEPRMAIRWVIEAPYFAISEDQMESVTFSKDQFEACLGSARYRICHETIATQTNHPSCLATLFVSSTLKAAETCDTEVFYLPTQANAANLGYGIWLITSASDSYEMREYSLDSVHKSWNRIIPGCKICIITVECNYQIIVGENLKTRSDLESCDRVEAKLIDVKLLDPLEHLMSEIPQIDQMPYFESRTTAGVEVLRKVRAELIRSPKIKSSDDLVQIARPITADMRTLKPTLVSEFKEYVPLKLSLSLTVIVFIGNIILHILFFYLYHRFKIIRKFVPSFLKSKNDDIGVKPVISVKDNIAADAIPQKWKDNYHILTEATRPRSKSRSRTSLSTLNKNVESNSDPCLSQTCSQRIETDL